MEGEQAGSARSKWLSHVKKTMKAHKGKSLKQVLKMAKKTYKKTMKTKRGGAAEPYQAPSTASPLSGGKRRGGKTRKVSRKH